MSGQVREDKGSKPHWNQLYELNKIRMQAREVIADVKKAQDEKAVEGFTFQPRILETSAKIAEKLGPDFMERDAYWRTQKNQKIKEVINENKDKDLAGCTFQPKVNKQPKFESETSVLTHSGANKYIERQILARKEKERIQEILSGGVAKRKDVKPIVRGAYSDNNIYSSEMKHLEMVSVLQTQTFSEAALSLHEMLNDFEL